jgi:putative CocE/NonD family hydrolase
MRRLGTIALALAICIPMVPAAAAFAPAGPDAPAARGGGLPDLPGADLTAETVMGCDEGNATSPRPSWSGDLTERRETNLTTYDAQIPSSDGTRISARVHIPTNFSEPYPTVLILSPYWALNGYPKEQESLGVAPASCDARFFNDHGYATVLADMRGTRNTPGCFDYGGPKDRADANAVVDWIGEQGWSNGSVGMYGLSHVGWSQYMAAVTAPPALDAVIPAAPVTNWYRYLYDGGVHYETNMFTPGAYEGAVAAPPPTNPLQPGFADAVATTGCNVPEPTAYQMQPENGMEARYEERDLTRMAGNIEAAVFHVHGTSDENVKTDHFADMWRALEAEDVTRKALLGPWDHQFPTLDWWNLTALRWYEHHLKGIDTGMMDESRVTVLDQEERARTAGSFPPDGGDELVYEAGETDLLGEGVLAESVAAGESTYRDNPALHRAALREAAGNRLIYTGSPLDDPIRLSGAPQARIQASIDTADTNLAIHLFDVDENGNATYVTRGYLDARHRNGLDDAQDVPPGTPQVYELRLHPRDWVFDEGHRVQMLVASSDRCPWLLATPPELPTCHKSGIVPDDQVATVTVQEGLGRTTLTLPTAPLDPAPVPAS